MTDLENDRRELLERQLAERVTQRVQPALFKLYATVGVAVIGAIGFVSWDIVDDIKDEIKSEIKDKIDEDTEETRAEIVRQTIEARYLAGRANEVIKQVEKQLNDFQPHVDDLDESLGKIKKLNVDSQNLTAAYSKEFLPLVSNVEALSSQLRTLAEQVQQLNKIATVAGLNSEEEPVQTFEARGSAIQSVISDTKSAEELLERAREKTTVFFQFAGGSREQAVALSKMLEEENYVVPGEDRERRAAGKHEVRYFHEEDGEAARRLADDTTRALQSLLGQDYKPPNITAKSFVPYTGKKPSPGVLELWLQIP